MARKSGRRITRLPASVYVAAGAGIILLGASALLIYHPWRVTPRLDANLQKAIENVALTTVHAEYVETEAHFPDRTIRVVGTYLVDDEHARYAAYSTTTLIIPGMKPASFTLANLAISPHVYTLIQTRDESLVHTIPHSPDWRRFRQDAIPAPFANISIPGPILNNLRLFSDQGRYVTLVRMIGTEGDGSTATTHYSFRLSPVALRNDAEGTLGALIERIGPDGTIDAWIDASSTIRQLVFASPSYHSTTTVLSVGTPLMINPPVGLDE